MSWGDVDFLSLRPFRKNPVELVSWEAIFEVVAPSDVEDPRRPCGRHGHGALCHLALKNRFCTWKMVDFRSRWFQALGGSVVYGYLLPVIPDFRSSFFLGDAIMIRWLRLIWFLVLQRMRVRQRVTACVQPISDIQFISAKLHPSFWMTLRLTDSGGSGEVAGCQMSGLATSHLRYIIFSKTSKASFFTMELLKPRTLQVLQKGVWFEVIKHDLNFWCRAHHFETQTQLFLTFLRKEKIQHVAEAIGRRFAILAKKVPSLKLT